MKSIRTKLVLAFFVMTLLPLNPVYYLVKNLMQQSLEVGYNENVEKALEEASQISRQLYAKYKAETLNEVQNLSDEEWIKSIHLHHSHDANFKEKLKKFRPTRLEFFNLEGLSLHTWVSGSNHHFPKLYQNIAKTLAQKDSSEIIEGITGSEFIHAFAPVFSHDTRVGSLVLSKAVDENFRQGSQQIVKVNQMFKTLDFFENDLKQSFLNTFFIVYAPIAALSIAVGYYFSRKMTTPLLELVEGTKKVAAGDWDTRVKISSSDEVGELVGAFNTMVSNLKEKQTQVVALEKMAAWREIARVLAHEIKNPLTPIQLTAQQMKDKYVGGDDEYKKLLAECSEIISDEIESLRSLVREFSEFARMPKLNLSRGSLNELVEDVGKLFP